MGELRDKMESCMQIAGYKPGTQKIYLSYAKRFAKYFMRSPAEMGADEVLIFMSHLMVERKLSYSVIRQARASLRFLYMVTLRRPIEIEWLPVPRQAKPLRSVLSGSQVEALLNAVREPRYRVILMAMYSGGLRISEACALRPEDIQSSRKVILVHGKGGKERQTLLSPRFLRELREYWVATRPDQHKNSEWLFPGGTKVGHISKGSVRRVFHKAAGEVGLPATITPHALRHSFATHLLEMGTSLAIVKEALGHAKLETTMVYTHTSTRLLARTKSPFELLGTPDSKVLG